MARRHLQEVAFARIDREAAEQQFRNAIVAAVGSGETHADVAEKARLTRGRISQIVAEEASA